MCLQVLFSNLLTRHSRQPHSVSQNDMVSSQGDTSDSLTLREHNAMSTSNTEKSHNEEEVPRFYKRDLMCILQEKNDLKEECDSLTEELEEWKKYLILVDLVESLSERMYKRRKRETFTERKRKRVNQP